MISLPTLISRVFLRDTVLFLVALGVRALTCNGQWQAHPGCLDGGSSHYEHGGETRAKRWKMGWNGTATRYNGTISLFFPPHSRSNDKKTLH